MFAARVSYRRGRTKTLPRYVITLLIALAPFLPVLWGAFPQMPLWIRIGIGLLLTAVGYVEHRKNAVPTWP